MTTADPEHPQTADAPELPLLERPSEPLRDVVEDERRLREAVASIAAGTGPLAIDAERASGYRYGQTAYLVQLRRAGAGTWLIDPSACPDLSELQAATADVEWVLHAATQDLPCLRELGLHPSQLFDTELAARLVGLPRVGLAAAVEHYLGVTLAKEHSAVDWSTRPLPEPWLVYAALDVEILVELRDELEADLDRQGKLEWAREEFAALTSFTGPPPRVDPWRRTSGLHRIRSRRGLAVVRELWLERDALAQQRDTSPGRVLPDSVIVEVAQQVAPAPTRGRPGAGRGGAGEAGAAGAGAGAGSGGAAGSTGGAGSRRSGAPSAFGNRAYRRNERRWEAAVERAMLLPEDHLPPQTLPTDGPPPPRAWADKDPVAAAWLTAARDALAVRGADLAVPVENLLSPDLVRRTLWSPPSPLTVDTLADALRAGGARPWQVEQVAPLLATTHPSTLHRLDDDDDVDADGRCDQGRASGG